MTDQEREQILKMIEDGTISPEEGLKLMQVLEQDLGEPSDGAEPADAAGRNEPARETSSMGADPRIARVKGIAQRLWQVPLWIGMLVTLLSAYGLYALVRAGQLNFWFYFLILPLLLGVALMATAVGTRRARWLFVDVHQKEGERPNRIFLGFPLPLRLTAWGLRTFGGRIESLKSTQVDEIIQLIETGFRDDEPLVVDVDEGEEGEKVKVYIG